jgi:hypothetical protein
VRGKLFVWMSPHEKGALCVRVDPDEKDFLIRSNPEVYFSTPHYEGYPAFSSDPSGSSATSWQSGSRMPGC